MTIRRRPAVQGRRCRDRWFAAAGIVGLATSGLVVTAPAALAVEAYDEVVEITFPVDHTVVRFSDDYDAPRGGGSRVHMATDLIVPKHTPTYAATDGVVCYITGIDEPEPSWGYHLKICGDDGIEYDYIHINNDTPGTDDGQGGPEHAYAPGIDRGVRVAAGQLIGWAGDSGNAENTVSHIHFEMESSDVTSPYGTQRMNPYPSLVAALEAGRVSDGTAVATDPRGRVAGPDRVATALAVAEQGFDRAATVVLARSDLPWPAIVAGPLAAVHDGPVLTTAPGELDERVRARIGELGASAVYVVGPVDFDLDAALDGLGVTEVVLLDGGDRYATSAMVAELVWQATGAVRVGEQPDGPELEPPGPIYGTPFPFAGDLLELEDDLLGVAEGWLSLDDLADDAAAAAELLATEGPTLVVYDSPERVGAHLLDGAVVSVDFAVQLLGLDPREVERVDFWYDTTDLDRRRDQRERFIPYDAAGGGDGGPGLFDVEAWGEGGHVLAAEVLWLDGTRQVLEASFEVVAGDRVPTSRNRQAILALGDHDDPNRSWPDALMASYYGSARQVPVLLTPPSSANRAIAEALTGVEGTWVIGGPGAIADTILDDLAFASGSSFQRLAGRNRYATALQVVDDLVERRLVDASSVWVATGHNWPDATAAGPVVAAARDVLVLLNGTGAGGDDDTRAWLAARADAINDVTALGGPAAVSQDVLRDAAIAIT